MRKPNVYLWMLTLSLFLPLAAFAGPDDPKPTLTLEQMTPAQRAAYLKKLEDDDAKLNAAAFNNTLAAGADAATLAKLRAQVAADQKKAQDDADQKAAAEKQKKDEETVANSAGKTIPNDVTTWDALKKLIPDVKMVYDRAGSKDYTASVHLEGTIPKACVDQIGTGAADFLSKYDGSQKIDSLAKLDVPFRGWNFRTSDAAQECVDQFLKDRKDRKASGYCRTEKFPSGQECISLRDVTRIDNLAGGPKVGFFSCEGDGSDCKVEFYQDGKSADDVKRVADSKVYSDANRRVGVSINARKTNLKLWKVKNVDQCYGYGKKMSLADLFTDVADLKGKLKEKEDLSPYVKKGLNNEIARLKQLAESGKNVSELSSFSNEVADFYRKYLATSRSDLPNPDLDRMRRDTLALFKTMERRVLDDDSALKNPGRAKSDAEAIISNALALSPEDINLKNEMGKQGGIAVDTMMKAMQRKQIAYNQMLARCQGGQQGCDPIRLQAMYQSLAKSNLQAAQFYQKLQLTAQKACARGRKRSADPFDDEGLVVDGSDDDDEVSFTSRCDAAKDNLNRVWRRVQENATAVQNSAGPDPRIVQQLSQQINGQNALPNATIQPGQNGYNPALAYALDPNRFPGNFSGDFLRSLAPQLQPSTALGTGQMCLTGVGQTSNCFAQGNQITVQGAQMPPALPVRPM